MDPDRALANARAALARMRQYDDECGADYTPATEAADDLAEAFEALDGWLSKGGFLPKDWSAGR